MSDDDNGELDISWIDEHKRILSVDHNYQREPLEHIMFHFCYYKSDTIDKVITEKYIFRDKSSIVPLSDLSKIIEDKSKNNSTLYEFVEHAVFVVDLEPENIQSYVKTDVSINFLTEKKDKLADIVCPQSIFLFHSMNSIIVLFKECKSDAGPQAPKSILKKYSHLTKKMVKFHQDHSKTKRN